MIRRIFLIFFQDRIYGKITVSLPLFASTMMAVASAWASAMISVNRDLFNRLNSLSVICRILSYSQILVIISIVLSHFTTQPLTNPLQKGAKRRPIPAALHCWTLSIFTQKSTGFFCPAVLRHVLTTKFRLAGF